MSKRKSAFDDLVPTHKMANLKIDETAAPPAFAPLNPAAPAFAPLANARPVAIVRPVAFRPSANPVTFGPNANGAAVRNSTSSGGRKTRKCKNDATFVWLNLWFKVEFEKLGWIVLARKKGYDEKVNAYINSVERLYHQLGCKIKDTKDHDRKRDLMIMYKDVKYLMDHIHKDF